MKVWPTAIPQYELGHLPLIKELEKAESKLPGLWVCGNYRTGVAFPDCVTFGYEHAKLVKQFLDSQQQDDDSASINGRKAPSVKASTPRAKKLPFFLSEKSNGAKASVESKEKVLAI